MPLTVITLKSVPQSLRGDLTKWMQEIATGVYVGNFNAKVREQLWERVKDSVGRGEATMSFAYRNEIGYRFTTLNTAREVIDYDGIPLVFLPDMTNAQNENVQLGYSRMAKYQKMKRWSAARASHAKKSEIKKSYVVIDIETDGLDYDENTIIEIGAVKVEGESVSEFNSLIKYEKALPAAISELTGITEDLLRSQGESLELVLERFVAFVGDFDIVGYGVDFDMKFINIALKSFEMPVLKNRLNDLLRHVKNEKLFLKNYKLQTVLQEYGIDESVPHRALADAWLVYELSTKVNKFLSQVDRE